MDLKKGKNYIECFESVSVNEGKIKVFFFVVFIKCFYNIFNFYWCVFGRVVYYICYL